MVKEEIKDHELENDEIHRLLMSLQRVEAPRDFDFKVKARIAQGRPTETGSSWVPSFLRVAIPAALMLTVGGYVGFWAYSSETGSPTVAVAETRPEPVTSVDTGTQPQTQVQTMTPAPAVPVEPADTLVAEKVEPAAPNSSNVNVKAAKKPGTPSPEQPAGGSYDMAGTDSKKISRSQEDEDDLVPSTPRRRVIVSAGEFLRTVGITSTSTGSGGNITAVSGTAASVGIKAGDVIEWVNVQTRTVRVTREGKALTFQLQ